MQSTAAKATTSMHVTRLTASIGAEVSGVDLGEVARSDELFAELKALLLAHKVLFFRDQDITRAEHVQLAERFGPLEAPPRRTERSRSPRALPHLQGPRQPA